MSTSAGTGSPSWFLCPNERRQRNDAYSYRTRSFRYEVPRHEVELTGKTRPYRAGRGSAMGIRSTHTSRQYRCTYCRHVGWSNHIDLARLADKEAS